MDFSSRVRDKYIQSFCDFISHHYILTSIKTAKVEIGFEWRKSVIYSGFFSPDRQAVSTHLPLASSRSTPQEEERLLAVLEELALKFKP